jgi:hypothetical protein
MYGFRITNQSDSPMFVAIFAFIPNTLAIKVSFTG